MSNSYELTASVRDRVGKGAARATRREGLIPAVIYGDKQEPLSIALDYKTLDARLHAGGFLTTVATIDVNGDKIRVIPRDYQLHPVTDRPIHVDFLRVSAGATVHVAIPVQFINEEKSPGIKRGGVLNVVRHEIDATAPADAIPDHIVVDLTGTEIGDSIHISAVKLPEAVKPTIADRDFTIATIAAPAVLRDETPSEEGGEETPAA